MKKELRALIAEVRALIEADDFYKQARDFVSKNRGVSVKTPAGQETKVGVHVILVKVDLKKKVFVSFLNGKQVGTNGNAAKAYQDAADKLAGFLEKQLRKAAGVPEPDPEKVDSQTRIAADFFARAEKW